MRVILQLQPINQTMIPFNYQWYISSAIYKLLATSSNKYSTGLHNSRQLKLFSFSYLHIPQLKINNGMLNGSKFHQWELTIGSLNNQFIYHLCNGSFNNQTIRISSAEFTISNISPIKTPIFGDKINGKTISPITYSKPTEKYPLYLSPNPPIEKFNLTTTIFKQKLITIKENTPAETKIKSFDIKFILEAHPDLIKTAWNCGLGDHNSQGFGMFNILKI